MNLKTEKKIYSQYVSSLLAQTHNIEGAKKHNPRFSTFIKYNILKHFPNSKEISIADAGCGLGETLLSLNHFGYKNVIGFDISSECVDFCNQNGGTAVLSDFSDFFKERLNYFDVILLSDSITHIEKDSIIGVLTACKLSLKKDGVLIIKTYNASNGLLASEARFKDFNHNTAFTETSLKQVLVSAGFHFDAVQVYPSKLYVYYLNPLNYCLWLISGTVQLLLKVYFMASGKLGTKIFTKNIIAVAKK